MGPRLARSQIRRKLQGGTKIDRPAISGFPTARSQRHSPRQPGPREVRIRVEETAAYPKWVVLGPRN